VEPWLSMRWSFFPERGASSAPAKEVCRRCAVASECLAFALAIGDRVDGIWGGTSHGERHVILLHRRLEQVVPRLNAPSN
jgi:hypothetical protein